MYYFIYHYEQLDYFPQAIHNPPSSRLVVDGSSTKLNGSKARKILPPAKSCAPKHSDHI